MTEGKRNQKQAEFEVKTFPVPFALGQIKENLTINTNSPSEPSKKQIINLAFKFHSKGNILEASKYYQYFISKGFKNHIVFSNYGAILKNQGRLSEAESAIRKAIEVKPDHANSHYNLGLMLGDLGNLKEAELAILKAIKFNPSEGKFHSHLGIILKQQGKSKEAELATRRAIKLNPNNAIYHYNQGLIFTDLGNFKEAELATRKSIELKPDYVIAYFSLGIILQKHGNLEEAELALRKAIELKPDYAEAYSNLGTILQDLCKLEEAELALRKAIELKPDFAMAYFSLGVILNELGRYHEAISSFNKASNLEIKNPIYYAKRGLKISDLSKDKLIKNNHLIQNINNYQWEESEKILKEECIKHPSLTKIIKTEFINLWCTHVKQSFDKHYLEKLVPIFVNLVRINESNEDINNLVKYVFKKNDLNSLLESADKKEKMLITLSYCEEKFLRKNSSEIDILASNNIMKAKLLINEKETEDLGWLIVRRSLILFKQKDLARKNLTTLINNLLN